VFYWIFVELAVTFLGYSWSTNPNPTPLTDFAISYFGF